MTRRALSVSLTALALLAAGCSDDEGSGSGAPATSPAATASASSSGAPSGPAVLVSKGGSAREDGCLVDTCAKVRVELSGFEPDRSLRVACDGPTGTILDYAVTTDAQGASTSEECFFAFPDQTVTARVGEVTSNELVWPDVTPTATPSAIPSASGSPLPR